MIHRTLILIALLVCTAIASYGQRITNIEPEKQGNKIIVHYDIRGARFNEHFNVSLYVSKNGGKTFQGPLEAVSGDIGKGIQEGTDKKIVWDVFKDVGRCRKLGRKYCV